MKLFKSIDKKFEDIGFVKCKENEYGVTYERNNNTYNYTQRLDLIHKSNGSHIVQSYDTHLMDGDMTGNTCVGLTMYEIKLCLKKMKEMGWKIKK